MAITPDSFERGDRHREGYLVNVGAKLNVAGKEGFELLGDVGPGMPDLQLTHCQSAVSELSAHAHQRDQPKLHLMPVKPPVYVHIVKKNSRRSIQAEIKANPFIDNCAIALRIAKSIRKQL